MSQVESSDISFLRQDLVALKQALLKFSNNDISKMENLNASIDNFSKLMEQELFYREWDRAVNELKAKHGGSGTYCPDENTIITRIVNNRKNMEHQMGMVNALTKMKL